ncbi:CCR4-NOT transcription complex subunit 10 [Anabrus simplex]|uniref:CCR4-NOT transcription complex subunit 10 n=1 Tax=Anabrus simplex TaxID=316456 RepID=UPI0034DCEECB
MAEKENEGEKKVETPAAPVISDQERDWAQAALADFNKGSYGSCLQYLGKLETARPQDTKVLHNKAVVEYYKSDLKKTDQFRKNMNMVCSQAHVNIEDLDSLEDVEHCVIYYNQAVLLYHLKQYSTALKIMSKIFSFVEPMEESLAHRVCLLLIELHLCTYQPEKALTLISYIENQFVSTDPVITTEKDMKPLEKEHKEKKPVSVDAATDAFRLKLLQYRARCYVLTHALKACKREIKSIVTSGGLNLSSVFLKGNLEYLRGNYRKAIKVLNSIPQNTPSFKDTGECPAVLFYNNNGCIHHYMGKPNLACFYIQKALQENDSAMKSLPKAEPSEPYSGRPLYTLGSNKNYELMYNLGVCLLHAGKPIQAFDCLTEAVQVYHMNPRLWLRLAECCIMAHKPDNETDFNIQARRKDLVQGVVGSGPSRKLILASHLSKDTKYSCEGQSYAIPVATIEFASLCLKNALLLLPDPKPDEPTPIPPEPPEVPAAAATAVNTPCAQYAAPSSPLSPQEQASLRCSILAASAYVSLCLGEYVLALGHAQNLLAQPKLSNAHKMLGHLYCAEALILMDKISDAIDHLNPEIVKDISVIYPGNDKDPEHDKGDIPTEPSKPLKAWYPNNIPTARAIMQYNLAVAFAIRGEMDKAGETLKQVWMSKGPTCDVPIHVIMLALYIELQLGHADISRSIIKQHSPQYR